MDKIFDVEIDGQVILPDGRKLGPFEETTVNVVQPSEGGSDPVVENAKETGGIGWTEEGEQTVITWDGNTEGRDVLTIIDSESPDAVVRMYKVAEYSSKQFTENCELFAAGSQFPVTLYTYDHAEMYGADAPFVIRTDGTDFDIQGVGTVHAESSGVYFLEMGGAYVESITYGPPDTIHNIDHKYISGDIMICHIDMHGATYTCDKTFQEIYNAVGADNSKLVLLHNWGHVYKAIDWDDDYVLFAEYTFYTEEEDDGYIYVEIDYFKINSNETIHNSHKAYKISTTI